MSDEIFRRRLKELRVEKKLTLEELANAIGTTKTTLSRYENGERSPKLQLVGALANYFNVDMTWLSGLEEECNQLPSEVVLPLDQKIATTIKEIRMQKKISKKLVADKLQISTQELNSYESGQKPFTVNTVFHFADALGVTFDDLFPTTTTEHFGEIPAILYLDEENNTIITAKGKKYVVSDKEMQQAKDFLTFLHRK
ncbi:helix-turn-helix domain-containing protein [Enterococcus faecium]|nr:helix-turn-helix domain-containing protein [Enterococcus faecium]